ncbi:MAG TPA: ATP-binding protein [Xanthobacteraceae bacterium]|nr:ATP-binding protein [Xanthobacteraceae bacterium]
MQGQPKGAGRLSQYARGTSRFALRAAQWIFLGLGVAAISSLLFVHLYSVNESIYDPFAFAVGVSGLFAAACGVIALLTVANRRLRAALLHSEARCEQLADQNWELQEAEERAKNLLETQGDLIVRRDASGRITYANDAFCALAGRPREALLGTTATLEVIEQGKVTPLLDGSRLHDQKIMTASGPRWLAWREVVVRVDSNDCTEVQSVGRDITERVEVERALRVARDAAEAANRAKSRFLAMVSHEIRTPLNGMLGMTELLLDTPLTPEQTSYVRAAKKSGETLLALIEDILDFSKIEAGKLDLAVRPFNLSALVEDIIELLAPRAQEKGLEIASDLDERLPACVTGDPVRLRQVLLNLAGNAIKFTETGGVSVTVEPGAQPEEIVFLVRDTGIGITPEQQGRIFLEFEQADGSATRKFGGTGLGLAISRRIVDRMGGSIGVESVPGEGAAFRVVLRLTAAESDEATFAPPRLAGSNILIVAPPSVAASLLARRLVRWGASVVVAPEQVAQAALGEREWNSIIVDHALGPAATAAIAQQIGEKVARRIILITPSERPALAALKEAGFTGYLVKPVRAASLKAQLLSAGPVEAPVEDPAPRGHDDAGEPAVRKRIKVLVAEDNEVNALLTRSILTKLGHWPTVAASGTATLEAWNAARSAGAPFDLVLMDLHMPGIDGLEATRRIRAAEAETNHRTPIFALTANAFADDREACLAAGMDGFLVKPLDRRQLVAVLNAVSTAGQLAA